MPDWTTPDEVAAAVGVTAAAVRFQCRKRKLRARRHGSGPRAIWEVSDEYLDPATYRAAVGRPGRKAKTR